MAAETHLSRQDAELRIRVAMVPRRQQRLLWSARLCAAGVGAVAVVAFGIHALVQVLG